ERLINVSSHVDLGRAAIAHKKADLEIRVSEEPTLLGSAGTLLANREWVAGESSFWVLYGDVLTSTDLAKMAEFHRRRRPVATMGSYQVKEPTRCGVVGFDDNF